jgi:hypothetical protein
MKRVISLGSDVALDDCGELRGKRGEIMLLLIMITRRMLMMKRGAAALSQSAPVAFVGVEKRKVKWLPIKQFRSHLKLKRHCSMVLIYRFLV